MSHSHREATRGVLSRAAKLSTEPPNRTAASTLRGDHERRPLDLARNYRDECIATELHDAIIAGIPARHALATLQGYAIPKSEILAFWGVSMRWLNRAVALGGALGPDVSDRAVRLEEAYAHATEVFGTSSGAGRWLVREAMALGGRRPIDLLRTSQGTELVHIALARIDWGVYI